jgi:hypothetical protein
MRCRDCSQVRGYPYKRRHLVALRTTKISASDPPSKQANGAGQEKVQGMPVVLSLPGQGGGLIKRGLAGGGGGLFARFLRKSFVAGRIRDVFEEMFPQYPGLLQLVYDGIERPYHAGVEIFDHFGKAIEN